MKTIHYYEFVASQPDAQLLRASFGRHISKFYVPFFAAGSAEEQSFLQFCRKSGHQVHRKKILEYSAPATGTGPLYLCLKDDAGRCISEANPPFIDASTACPGGGACGSCNRGALPSGNAVVNARGLPRVNDLGFIVTRLPTAPKIYLLSTKLAQILRASDATGCEILPCEVRPATGDRCYELRITVKTPGPARLGQVSRVSHQCPRCGAVKGFIATEERHFREKDLAEVDFQVCDSYESENLGRFVVPLGFPIVSRRIFEILLHHRVKGLDRYTTDPPVKHAVVQVD